MTQHDWSIVEIRSAVRLGLRHVCDMPRPAASTVEEIAARVLLDPTSENLAHAVVAYATHAQGQNVIDIRRQHRTEQMRALVGQLVALRTCLDEKSDCQYGRG